MTVHRHGQGAKGAHRARAIRRSSAIIGDFDLRGTKVVIAQHPRRIGAFPLDRDRYAWRHFIENLARTPKAFDRIAVRAC